MVAIYNVECGVCQHQWLKLAQEISFLAISTGIIHGEYSGPTIATGI